MAEKLDEPIADVAMSVPRKDLLAEVIRASLRQSVATALARPAAKIIRYPNAVTAEPVGGATKRAFDVIGASAIILLALPLIALAFIAAALQGAGGVFFGHRRIGFRGGAFRCLKFRSMAPDAEVRLKRYLAENPEAAEEWMRDQKLRKDPRITTIGAILRKTSLDELPQLINVLRGEMSLVGPRPVTEEELFRYGDRRAAYLSARPGLTGLWQVSGRNSTTYERRTELDAEYVANWSLQRDVVIILKTIPAMLGSSKGV